MDIAKVKLPCVVKLDLKRVVRAELKGYENVKALLGDHAPRVLDTAEEGDRAGLRMEMAGATFSAPGQASAARPQLETLKAVYRRDLALHTGESTEVLPTLAFVQSIRRMYSICSFSRCRHALPNDPLVIASVVDTARDTTTVGNLLLHKER